MATKVVPINKNGPGPIESDVPMPSPTWGNSIRLYHFDKMKVGDSFTVLKARRYSVWQSAMVFKKTHRTWAFTTRTEDNRIRIWRIK